MQEQRSKEQKMNTEATLLQKGILPKGFPTHTKDITGQFICLGDMVDHDFEDNTSCPFEIVFEENAFRIKYKKWDKRLTRPLLEFGYAAQKMKLKIVKKYNSK